MTEFEAGIIAFAVFGVASQGVPVCFFAARRWSPGVARRFGWLAYAFAGFGLPIGAGLFLSGESWRLVIGLLLMAVWALVGVVVDLWRQRQWRDPIKWNVFVPYVGLFSGPRCSCGGRSGMCGE